MAKNIIRLTESDLHRIVKGSVNRVLKEWDEKEEDILASLQNNKDRAEEGSLYGDLNKKRIYREICKFEAALGALQVDENSEWYENLYSALSDAKAANRTRKEIEKDEYYQDPGWEDSPRRF
jgi:hypothetical protein